MIPYIRRSPRRLANKQYCHTWRMSGCSVIRTYRCLTVIQPNAPSMLKVNNFFWCATVSAAWLHARSFSSASNNFFRICSCIFLPWPSIWLLVWSFPSWSPWKYSVVVSCCSTVLPIWSMGSSSPRTVLPVSSAVTTESASSVWCLIAAQ